MFDTDSEHRVDPFIQIFEGYYLDFSDPLSKGQITPADQSNEMFYRDDYILSKDKIQTIKDRFILDVELLKQFEEIIEVLNSSYTHEEVSKLIGKIGIYFIYSDDVYYPLDEDNIKIIKDIVGIYGDELNVKKFMINSLNQLRSKFLSEVQNFIANSSEEPIFRDLHTLMIREIKSIYDFHEEYLTDARKADKIINGFLDMYSASKLRSKNISS